MVEKRGMSVGFYLSRLTEKPRVFSEITELPLEVWLGAALEFGADRSRIISPGKTWTLYHLLTCGNGDPCTSQMIFFFFRFVSFHFADILYYFLFLIFKQEVF